MKTEPVQSGPVASQAQLEQAKHLGKLAVSQGRTLDELSRSSRGLTDALNDLGTGSQDVGDIEHSVADIRERLAAIATESNERVKTLELAQVCKKYQLFTMQCICQLQ